MGEGQRARGNLKQAPCSDWSPTRGFISPLWDHDLSWSQESDAEQTEPPGGPETPRYLGDFLLEMPSKNLTALLCGILSVTILKSDLEL